MWICVTKSKKMKSQSLFHANTGYLPTLFEFHYDASKKKWVTWSSLVTSYIHYSDLKFIDILGNSFLNANSLCYYLLSIWHYTWIVCSLLSISVPTVDTVRANWLLERMVKIKRPVVLVGESGTSKTATTQNFLNKLNTDTTVRMIYSWALSPQRLWG